MAIATAARTSHGPVADTFFDVEDLIYKAVWRFRVAHGHTHTGNLEDMVSEAKVGFMRAYKRFDHRKGNFGARVSFVVFHHLKDKARKYAAYRDMEPKASLDAPCEIDGTSYADKLEARRQFCINAFSCELSRDARQVVRLLFKLERMQAIAKGTAINKERPESKRIGIAKLLRKMGWTRSRIQEAFEEIGKAL